jgi:hypothetical protein
MSASANLDIRYPMGALFAVLGLLLILYGLTAETAIVPLRSNIDVWWGLIMLVFGALLLSLAHASHLRYIRNQDSIQ